MTTTQPTPPNATSPGGKLLAWNLRKYRIAAGISQEQLGSNAGVDRTYVSRLERAIENPSLAIIDRLAAALGVHISLLMHIPPPEEPTPQPMKAGRRKGYRYQKPSH